MLKEERDFRERVIATEGSYSSDFSVHELGVNVPNKNPLGIKSYEQDDRYDEYVSNTSFVSAANRSNDIVRRQLERDYDDESLDEAIYWMTLNIGYDWARQYKLLTSAGFKVTKNQIRKDVKQCLEDYKDRRRKENLAFTYTPLK